MALGSLQNNANDAFVESPTRASKTAVETTVSSSALPTGAATEAKQDAIITALTTLQSYTDGLESLLTFINSNTDGLEGFVDGLETLVSNSNTILTNISNSAVNLESYTDGLESLVGSTNTLLTSISGYVDQLEGYTDGIEGLLNDLKGYTDTLEALIGTTNSTLSTGIATMLDKTALGSLTALNDTLEIATNGCGTVGIQITGTWVGRIQFQGTNDNSTWFAVTFLPRSGTAAIAASTTGNTQGEIPCAGLLKVRLLRDIATSGTAVASMSAGTGTASVYAYSQNANNFLAGVSQVGTWTVQPGNTPNTSPWLVTLNQGGNSAIVTNTIPSESSYGQAVRVINEYKRTYSAAGVIAAATSPTDFVTITGSNTATVRITKIIINGICNTASFRDIFFIKRSTANTGGTSTAVTAVPYQSSDAAATATVLAYTVNPTLGTTVGNVLASKLYIPDSAKAVNLDDVEYNHQDGFTKEITLTGTNEVLAINLNGVSTPGNSFAFTIEWVEE